MRLRWLVVAVVTAALVVVPVAVSARPTADVAISSDELAARIAASADQPWSGLVESTGSLAVPDADSFAGLVRLLGEPNRLRAWWRSPDSWRVDQIRSTGETDLWRMGTTSVRWEFESQTAVVAPVSTVRLPDSSDLLPPTLARTMLQGVRPTELSALPSRRVAGVTAAGLRLVPDDAATTVARVDLWADPSTGLAVRVELYGHDDPRPVVVTELRDLDRGQPDRDLLWYRPGPDVRIEYQESVDVAAAANALSPYDFPPSLAGLTTRSGEDPGAVAVYGRGPTTLFVLPLRGQVAGPLRQRLLQSAAVERTGLGTLLPVGPISLMITNRTEQGSVLLAGTVTPQTLRRAAEELARR